MVCFGLLMPATFGVNSLVSSFLDFVDVTIIDFGLWLGLFTSC